MICNECETVAHCLKNGCVPKQPATEDSSAVHPTPYVASQLVQQSRSDVEPAFHGFMDKENCCVHLCFTPHAPGGRNNELATAYYTALPAAQRQWVWLSHEDEQEIKDNCTTVACVLKAVKAKLKEKNT